MKNVTTFYVGREFLAVFLNTSEPVWEDGSTRNPTKSICDPFVFNTVLTRAKALVFAVGNPFNLLRSEQHMVRRYGEKGRCWSEFLKCCLQHNTLHAVNPAMQKRCRLRLEELFNQPSQAVPNPATLSVGGQLFRQNTAPLQIPATGIQRKWLKVPYSRVANFMVAVLLRKYIMSVSIVVASLR